MHSFFWLAVFTTFSLCLCSGPAASGGDGKAAAHSGASVDTDTTKFLRERYSLMLVCPYLPTDEDQFDINWFKDNQPLTDEGERYKIYPSNSSLYIPSAVMDDIGVYRCQTEGSPAVRALNISVISVVYKKMPKSVTVLQGDKLALVCEAEGTPDPVVTWLKDGKSIFESINETRFELDANEKGVVNASFEITKADYIDRGEYACFITSEGITFNTTSFVRVKDMYAALWPFLGICAEVIVLCIIIFIYEKRRMKIEFEESDNDQPENKTTTDNKDVRQRK